MESTDSCVFNLLHWLTRGLKSIFGNSQIKCQKNLHVQYCRTDLKNTANTTVTFQGVSAPLCWHALALCDMLWPVIGTPCLHFSLWLKLVVHLTLLCYSSIAPMAAGLLFAWWGLYIHGRWLGNAFDTPGKRGGKNIL